MPYEHSFAAEFYSRGEEDDRVIRDRPLSVMNALYNMSVRDWEQMVMDVMNVPRDKVEYCDVDMIMSAIADTNIVTNLDVPVEVWIDGDGDWRILVYEDNHLNE
jgi:hypothetical protein